MADILTMGTFDALHPGHLGLLARCRALAGSDTVTVAVNTDEFVERFKPARPIFTLEERFSMVAACRFVDRVVVNDGDDQPGIIARELGSVTPSMLVIGDDWQARDYLAQIGLADDRGFLDRRGVELVYLPRTGDWSTTEVRERLTK